MLNTILETHKVTTNTEIHYEIRTVSLESDHVISQGGSLNATLEQARGTLRYMGAVDVTMGVRREIVCVKVTTTTLEQIVS